MSETSGHSTTSPTSRRNSAFLNGAILAGALAIRLVGVSWALPYVYHADEPTNYRVLHAMVRDRSIDPHFFHYPSFFFDIQAAVHAVYSVFASTTSPIMQTGGNGLMRSDGPLLTARLVTVVLGVALVGAGMVLAWIITRCRSTTAVAGILLAINPILVRNARWVTPDTLAGLTATLAVIAAVIVARHPQRRHYVIAGIAIGLAVSSKYNAALVAVPLVVAHVSTRRAGKGRNSDLWIAAAAAAGAYLVTSPFSLLDPGRFWQDFWYEIEHYRTGHPGNQGGSLQVNVAWLWNSMGPLLLLAFGVPWVRATTRRLLLLPAIFAGVYFLAVSVPKVRFERNLVPLLPSLLVVIAVVAVELVDRLRMKSSVAITVGVVLVLWPLGFAVRDARAATHDERTGARNWITNNVRAGSSIVVEAYSPWVDPGRYKVTTVDHALVKRPIVEAASLDAVIVTTAGSGRYLDTKLPESAQAKDTLAWLQSRACSDLSFGHGQGEIEVLRLRCGPIAPAPPSG